MKSIFIYVGTLSLFVKEIIFALPKFYKSKKLIIEQIITIGVGSLPLICISMLFTGGVTALQAKVQGSQYLPDVYIGMSVIKAFMIELGPLLTGIIVTGKSGSAIAAEIGAMKITEQIDALETLAIDPIKYLVVPRVVACLIVVPLLTWVAEISGCVGGGIFSILVLHIKPEVYIVGLKLNFMPHELWGGLVKALTFGLIIGIMSSYYGFKTEGGTEGVGRAATRAVISIFMLILISDFIVAKIVF